MSDESEKTFLQKLMSCFSSVTGNKSEKNHENDDLTDEPQKTFFEKFRLCFSFCTAKNKKDNSRLKKFNYAMKRPKSEVKKPDKSLRTYIKRNWKLVVSLIGLYFSFAALVSSQVVVNFLLGMSQNKRDQERFINSNL